MPEGMPRYESGCTSALIRWSLQRLHQPGNNNLLEDERVWPNAHLPSQVSALGIDPGFLRNITFTQQQIFVVDGNLRVEHPGQDEHRRHWFAQQALVDQR